MGVLEILLQFRKSFKIFQIIMTSHILCDSKCLVFNSHYFRYSILGNLNNKANYIYFPTVKDWRVSLNEKGHRA